MISRFYARLSLTAKIAVVIVATNLCGLGVTAWSLFTQSRDVSLARQVDDWTMKTVQIGETAQGSVRWKKASIIQEAYSTYRQDPSLGLKHFHAVTGKFEVADSWSAEGLDKAALDARSDAALKAVKDGPVVDRSVPGEVLVAVPLALDKKGQRMGYVATTWSTDPIIAAARQDALVFAGKQAAIIAIVIAVFFWSMRANVGRPLEALSKRIRGLEQGDLDSPVEHVGRHDVIGVIATALSSSIETTRRSREQAEASERERQAMDAERAAFTDRASDAARRQTEVVSEIGSALARLAKGEFTVQLGDLGPEFAQLKRDFHTMVEAVSHTLSDISRATDQVETGTSELARAADQLAKRTETQAAALEETAAALEEITQTVGQSTRKAEEAGGMIGQAKVSAHSSATVVHNAISAMGRIENSASQIGQIIGVIDEIAFQTNLLALNAGVEAARAGEAGKGFAVVAQEVRELAQRSAKAAKEIKQLVANSGQEVASGVALVNETGAALRQIEGQINAINESVQAIVASAREQSTGLSEVNEAIRRMDETTQRNAAMVEETNAACQELESQSRMLKSFVGRFRTSGSAQAAPAVQADRFAQRTAAPKAAPQPEQRSQTAARPARSVGSAALAADTWEEF